MKTLLDSYKDTFRKSLDSSGRARRKEYWIFVLMNSLMLSVLGILTAAMGIPWLAALCSILAAIPVASVSIRRLHDTGRPGWWMLLMLAPVVGQLVLLVFFLCNSEPHANQYGEA